MLAYLNDRVAYLCQSRTAFGNQVHSEKGFMGERKNLFIVLPSSFPDFVETAPSEHALSITCRRTAGDTPELDFTHYAQKKTGPWIRFGSAFSRGGQINNENACKPKEESDSEESLEQELGKLIEDEFGAEDLSVVQDSADEEDQFTENMYFKHADLLAQGNQREANRLQDIGISLGWTNSRLWMSFCFFALLMFSLQPDELVPSSAKCRFSSALSQSPSICTKVCKLAPFLGGRPFLDPALRGRPEFAGNLYFKLFPNRRASAARFALWSYIDASFRFTGTISFVETTWLQDSLPLEFMDGLTATNGPGWVRYAQLCLFNMASLRTSVTALFDAHDGRRLTFRPSFMVPPFIFPISRMLDHLHAAYELWPSASVKVGKALLDLHELLSQEDVVEEVLFKACEQLILALLLYHLVGRPRLKERMAFARKIFSYAGKFLLQDHLHMLTKVLCVEQGALRCTCKSCTRILRIRQAYGMLGPAPGTLFKNLTEGASRTLWAAVFLK